MKRLEGKVALITGTGGGLGRAAALRFAREGARVVGCDLDENRAVETLRLANQAGLSVECMAPLDMSDEGDVQRWIEFALDRAGDFDILYNNASTARFGTIEEMSRADWDYTLANEVTLIFLAVKHAIPVFRRRGGGCVINVGSTAGLAGGGSGISNLPGVTAHGVAKAAAIALSQHLAIELSPLNVRVNTISPGTTETPGTAPLVAQMGDLMRKTSLDQKIGVPDDIVAAAVYLASDEARHVVGAHIVVDGGTWASGGLGRPGVAFRADLTPEITGLLAGHVHHVDAEKVGSM